MSYRAIVFSLLVVQILLQADAAVGQEVQAAQAEKRTLGDRIEELKKKALAEVGGNKEISENKFVRRGNMPEVVLFENKIFYNKRQLKLGDSLSAWKTIIGGVPRCYIGSLTLCVWDEIGIQIGTDHGKKQAVSFFNIFINFSEEENRLENSKNEIETKDELWIPRKAFPGYLEFDNFGIDKETQFSEIRTHSSSSRNLNCGLLDCSNPSGAFGTNAHLYLTLTGRSENSTLQRFSIDVPEN